MSTGAPDPIARLKAAIAKHQEAVEATKQAAIKSAQDKAPQDDGKKT